ncbi:thioredoxin-like protein CITRX, chloroplastic [Phragmites australis]|uniref:thioredoxin-like protein CITRX, chloroplastic n=1 Tax=Phragmites australis TaxID=29695 RepID=UPI002D7951CE|nr:thioredoxin-like protein CITRX, chloroplastic [Phragmites australis]
MAIAASLLPASAVRPVPRAPAPLPQIRLVPVPLAPARKDDPRGCSGVGASVSNRRAPTVRRNAAETTAYVPGSGKYIAPDYLVKKVTAKEVEELVRGERKVPLIVDFYATWCGPCVQMAQDIEMLAVEYEDNVLFVKVDTDDEYEFARDMQVRGLPTLYFFSPDQSKDAIRTEGLIPIDMIRNIIDNEL